MKRSPPKRRSDRGVRSSAARPRLLAFLVGQFRGIFSVVVWVSGFVTLTLIVLFNKSDPQTLCDPSTGRSDPVSKNCLSVSAVIAPESRPSPSVKVEPRDSGASRDFATGAPDRRVSRRPATERESAVAALRTRAETRAGGAGPDPKMPDPSNGRLECGETGAYGELPSSSTLHRDHVPSSGALTKRAEGLLFGSPLDSREGRALKKASRAFRVLLREIENRGLTIAIPAEVHRVSSETYGQRNSHARQVADASDLAAAARSNVKAIQRALADSDCLRAYNAGARRILEMKQADYDARLNAAIQSLSPKELKEIQQRYGELERAAR